MQYVPPKVILLIVAFERRRTVALAKQILTQQFINLFVSNKLV